jgi:ABC-2 type transport system ATP-binding protein
METLKVDGLTKQFGSFKAVDNFSFSVKEGEIVGFLGPNGAGKTTTIQMLLGITTPTAGSIAYFGHDFFRYPRRALEKINFTSAFNNLQGRMSTWENMLVFSHLYGVKDRAEDTQTCQGIQYGGIRQQTVLGSVNRPADAGEFHQGAFERSEAYPDG